MGGQRIALQKLLLHYTNTAISSYLYVSQLKKVLEIKTQLIFWDKVENELISQSANSKKSSEVTK